MLSVNLHLIDSLLQLNYGDLFLEEAQLHALIHHLWPNEVYNVTKLLITPIWGNFSLLNLQGLDQVPLEEMVIAREVALNIE